jgi:hypothetical protein
MPSQIKRIQKPRISKHPGALQKSKADQDAYTRTDRVDIPGRVANFQEGAGSGG